MKKLFIPLLAAAFLTAGGSAKAAVTGTNIVTAINIQLTYTSLISSSNTTATKNVKIGKITVPETISITTDKSVSTPIATADVIKALLAPNPVPKGAYLAHVQSVGIPADYFAVRVGKANLLVLSNQITSTEPPTAEARNGKSSYNETTLQVSVAAGSKDATVQTLTLTTGTLTFNVTALGLQTYTGASITVDNGLFSRPITDQTFTVIGTGADSLGTNEIVTGKITANGAIPGN